MNIKKAVIILTFPTLFFIVSFLTISDYGINWDEPIHFMRGQAYLYFFLTGKKEYDPFISNRPSAYQNRSYSTEYLLVSDSGHPPVNGILAAFFNLIFYQKLNLLGDIQAYHLFNILASSVLVLAVSFFAYRAYGVFVSVAAALTLSTYPFFFGETHFNIKDPPEAAFLGLTILTFWESLQTKNWRWFLISSICFGLALGTKFNAFFLPLILFPYLFIRYFHILRAGYKKIIDSLKQIPKSFKIMVFIYPFLSITILFASWPYLWQNPVSNFLSVVVYYKTIGTGINYQLNNYYFFGFNVYPIIWIIFTTPPLVLLLTFLGIVSTFSIKDKSKTAFLWLIWFLVPILRVTLPNTAIYGGVRQIMEYIPAMALLSGLGAEYLVLRITYYVSRFNSSISLKGLKIIFLLITLPFLLYPIIKYHPNENVYFNGLIGGLSGARNKNIPSWGNSYGNAYLQAIKWINKNAPKDAKVALIQGTGQNIGINQFRPDIKFNNTFWSGIRREGEYLMELNYQDSVRAYPFVWEYIDKFLKPVYEVKVDNVAIAKVWKNDLYHTNPEYKKKEVVYSDFGKSLTEGQDIILELKEKRILTRVTLTYNRDYSCQSPKGIVAVSLDGVNFDQEIDPYPTEFITEKDKQNDTVYYYFPGREARFIKLTDMNKDSCIFNNSKIEIKVLDNG